MIFVGMLVGRIYWLYAVGVAMELSTRKPHDQYSIWLLSFFVVLLLQQSAFIVTLVAVIA